MATPIIYRSESQAQWGRGIVAEDNGDKVVLLFENDTSPKTFKKASLALGLTTVELPAAEAVALEEKLRNRRRPTVLTSAEKKKRDEKKAKTAAAKALKPPKPPKPPKEPKAPKVPKEKKAKASRAKKEAEPEAESESESEAEPESESDSE